MKLKKTASTMALLIVTMSATLPALSYADYYAQDIELYNTPNAETVDSRAGSGPSDEAVAFGVALLFLGLCAVFCDSGPQSAQEEGEEYYYYRDDNVPSVQTGSTPVAPINSFYGDCHNPMGC